jgi:hypothetical protein
VDDEIEVNECLKNSVDENSKRKVAIQGILPQGQTNVGNIINVHC